jgi:plastocyanin
MITLLTLTRRGPLAAVTAVALTGAVAAPVAGAAVHAKPKKHKSVTKKVMVEDDFYKPTKMTIKVGDKVNFVWASDNINTHNVTLVKGPKGVKKKQFTSLTGSTAFHFMRKFTVAGKYHFLCTLHPSMMNFYLTVKK